MYKKDSVSLYFTYGAESTIVRTIWARFSLVTKYTNLQIAFVTRS